MKISTKSRYALRVLLDLALHQDEGYIPLKTIAERQGISKNYLDQIMMILNRDDYLKATRGSQGGYMLAKAPQEYSLGDIVRLTEGSITPLACLDEDSVDCDQYDTCIARQAWKGLGDAMTDYLDNLTLQDIIDNNESPNDFAIYDAY